MRVRILSRFHRNLALGAAVIVIGGFTAGCSSDTTRFSDGLVTGSTSAQPVVTPPNRQPYPGDRSSLADVPNQSSGQMASNQMQSQPVYGGGGGYSGGGYSGGGSVSSGNLPPVSSSGGMHGASTLPPVRSASIDRTPTGTVHPAERRIVEASGTGHSGWSRDGGTQITVNGSDTVAQLSNRFGVPAREILKANNLPASHRFSPGERIVIPVYTAASRAGAVQPGRQIADAGHDFPHEGPARHEPSSVPQEHVAVLPSSTKLRGKPVAAGTEGANARKAEQPTRIASAAGSGQYRVEPGDSIHSIARKTGASPEAIRHANNLKTAFLHAGQILTIPGGGGAKIAAASPKNVDPVVTATAETPKQQPAAAQEESHPAGYTPPQKAAAAAAEPDKKEAMAAPDTSDPGKMRWPVRGRIITPFGGSGGSSSDGIDISVPEGTPVKAAQNGVVIYSGNGLKEFGNTVLIRHDDGVVTVYGHNSKLEVKRGEKVQRGQEIALSGMSGTTPTPRLHFEVRKNSAPVNPTKYLE